MLTISDARLRNSPSLREHYSCTLRVGGSQSPAAVDHCLLMSRPGSAFELLAAARRASKIPCGRPRKKATPRRQNTLAPPRPKPIGSGTRNTGLRCSDVSSASTEFGSSHRWPICYGTLLALSKAHRHCTLQIEHRAYCNTDHFGLPQKLESRYLDAIVTCRHSASMTATRSRLAFLSTRGDATMAHEQVKHVRQRRRTEV